MTRARRGVALLADDGDDDYRDVYFMCLVVAKDYSASFASVC